MKNGDALYVQIYQRLLDEIRAGKYDNARLPTEREIMEQFYVSRIKARMDGYIRAYANHHLPVRSELSLSRLADHAKDAGMDKNDAATHKLYMQAIMRHLHAHPEITAVFGTEYVASKAAWDAAHISGWHVPQDLSIVGFDFDSSYLGLSHLTHIRQPQAEIGRVAVQMMASILRGEPAIPSRRLLEGVWVEGTTLGPPNHRTNFEGGMKL